MFELIITTFVLRSNIGLTGNMRKFSFVFLLLLLIGSLAVFISNGNLSPVGSKNSNDYVWNAVPSNSSFLLHISDLDRLSLSIDSSKYKEQLETLTFFDEIADFNLSIDSFFIERNISFQSEALNASFHLAGVGKMAPIIFKGSTVKKKRIKKFYTSIKSDLDLKVNSWMYNDIEVFEVTSLNNGDRFTFAYSGGLWMISQTSFLVEDAINELVNTENSRIRKGDFKNLWKTSSDNADATLVFSYPYLDLWFSTLLNRESIEHSGKLKEFADWTLLDFYLNEEGIFYTGNTIYQENHSLSHSTDLVNLPLQVMPNNSAFFYQVLTNGVLKEKWSGRGLVFLEEESFNSVSDKNDYLILESLDADANSNYLQELARSTKLDTFKQTYSSFDILSFWNEGELEKITGLKWASNHRLYYTNIGQSVVFSKKNYALELLIDKISNERTLLKDISFNDFNEKAKMNGEVNVYLDTELSKGTIESISNPILEDDLNDIIDNLRHFRQASLSFKKSGKLCSTSGFALYKEKVESKEGLLWKSKLNDNISAAPQLVKSIEDNSLVILLQDEKNMLYALNTSGQTIWTKQLDETLIGEVHAIDYFGNNKTHYLFNTANKIYWLDKKGKNIADFPMKLPANASCGLTFVEAKDQLKIFIPISNGNIYGYEANGKPLPNWNPKTKVGNVRFPIKHINANEKDYLIGFNSDGKVFNWKLDGTLNNSVETRSSINNDFVFDYTVKPNKLKTINKQGKVIAITLNGSLTTDQLSYKFPVTYFTMEEVSSSQGLEIVTGGSKCISLNKRTGRNIFTNCSSKENTVYEVSKLPSNNLPLIVCTNSKDKKVRLLDNKGNVINVLPEKELEGIKIVDLFESGENNLIAWSGKEVFAFRIVNQETNQ